MKFLLSFFFLQKWLDMLVDSIGRFYARDVKVVWDVKVVLRRL